MEMGLEKLELDTRLNELKVDGITIIKNFFSPNRIINIRKDAEDVFERQFIRFNYQGSFEQNMVKLFNEHFEVFTNCGKTIQQGLWSLYSIAVDPNLKTKLTQLGLQIPSMCTRPVLYFNHPRLAKDKVYYKTPPHQDWTSMQSSENSVVVWIPLVDVDENNGAVIFYPGTHKLGPLPYIEQGGFAGVDIPASMSNQIQPKLNVGDIAIFSTLLVHESGDILDNSIRWSCHFRYTDLDSQELIDRGYPNPYVYKPIIKK
jgi:ectoine hydroxylase-related dioxygenase (phytanoyl-CoA dioxygenase family)